jgi:hypothetical protein
MASYLVWEAATEESEFEGTVVLKKMATSN